MRAKFECKEVEEFEGSEEVYLEVVCGDTAENQDFNEATPSGELKMAIDNPEAMGFFIPGEEYYLDFSKVEKAETETTNVTADDTAEDPQEDEEDDTAADTNSPETDTETSEDDEESDEEEEDDNDEEEEDDD